MSPGYFHAPHDGLFTLAAFVPTRYGTTWLAYLAVDGDPDKAVSGQIFKKNLSAPGYRQCRHQCVLYDFHSLSNFSVKYTIMNTVNNISFPSDATTKVG